MYWGGLVAGAGGVMSLELKASRSGCKKLNAHTFTKQDSLVRKRRRKQVDPFKQITHIIHDMLIIHVKLGLSH
jgi:hypothetical protein